MNITYILTARGFVHLAAVIDWFSHKVLARRLSIAIDGKRAGWDNVLAEHLWRSLKHEEVYLRAHASVTEARAGRADARPGTLRCAAANPGGTVT